MKTLRLPYPISANRYWASRVIKPKAGGAARAMTHVTDEAKAYKALVGWTAKAAGFRPMAGPIAVSYSLHPKTVMGGQASRVCLDLSNCIKVLEDALNGVAWVDDKQVVSIAAKYGQPCPDGGITIQIWEASIEGSLI